MTDTASADGGMKLLPKSIERGQKVLPLMKEMNLTETKVNLLKGLPPMLMQNGFGQTIAYLQSKGNDYSDIIGVFRKLFGDNLMEKILKSEVKDYVMIQREAIEYAGWMKKFAQAIYKTSPQGGYDGNTAAE